MYNRLDRKKNPPHILMVNSGGLTDLADNAMKEAYLINDEELDKLCVELSDTSLDLFVAESLTYSKAKQILLAIKDIL